MDAVTSHWLAPFLKPLQKRLITINYSEGFEMITWQFWTLIGSLFVLNAYGTYCLNAQWEQLARTNELLEAMLGRLHELPSRMTTDD